ncbi:MAG: carbohydrate binding domain-containing protein [Pyrinomonadaceae bacterium]
MSLKLVKIDPQLAKAALVAAALICVVSAFFFIRWNFANAIASRLDLKRPESKLVIDWLIGLGPSDPQTHYAAAALFEKTFDPGDLTRSLNEYETAAALSPNNYLMWINVSRARNLNGDTAGSEAAIKRALELAPNYSAVQWAYGNLLIREGNTDDGFKLAAKAAESNADLARSAVVLALQIYDGDLAQVRRLLGDSEAINSALATALIGQDRADDAVESWSKLPEQAKTTTYKKLGDDLAQKLLSAKKFRLAARVAADLTVDGTEKLVVGQIANGGFENAIKLRGAGPFEWQIADGAEPQIGQSDSQKRSGKFGLFLMFNSFDAAHFRSVSQTVAVEPGGVYEFEGFYRSDLKTSAALKLEIADAASTATIASTPAFALAGDWTTLKAKFIVPAGTDGIVIRLAREGCNGPACRITGRLSFDDLSIKRL